MNGFAFVVETVFEMQIQRPRMTHRATSYLLSSALISSPFSYVSANVEQASKGNYLRKWLCQSVGLDRTTLAQIWDSGAKRIRLSRAGGCYGLLGTRSFSLRFLLHN